jgi:hypothetical protein
MIPKFPDLFPKRQRRKYRLSPQGRASLRRSIGIHKPWQKSTGPRTIPGKNRSSQNHLIHGLFSAEFGAERRMYWSAMREGRMTLVGKDR